MGDDGIQEIDGRRLTICPIVTFSPATLSLPRNFIPHTSALILSPCSYA